MTARRHRTVWGIGLLAYVAGGLFLLLMPILQPFVGVIVLLACASATTSAAKDDILVMRAALAEAVFAVPVVLSLPMSERPAWLQSVGFGSYLLGLSLPLLVILYRIWRPTR